LGSLWGKERYEDVPYAPDGTSWGPGVNRNGKLTAYLYYIPAGTHRIRNVTDMGRPKVRFFMDFLQAPPHRYTSGIGGLDNRNKWFALQITGSFRANESGTYKFRVYADDGAILQVDSTEVLDNDGLKAAAADKVGTVNLKRDSHTIRLLYFQGDSPDVALSVYVTPPGGTEEIFNARKGIGEVKEEAAGEPKPAAAPGEPTSGNDGSEKAGPGSNTK
jgi:hypothetical protein